MSDESELTEFEDDDLDSLETEVDEQPTDNELVEEVEPVVATSRVIAAFKKSFGEDEGKRLQAAWGDHAVENDAIVRAVVKDYPVFDHIYSQHQTEDRGLSASGVALFAQQLIENSNYYDLESLVAAHDELRHLYYRYVNEDGSFPPTGVYQILHRVGKIAGYRINRG